MTAKIQGIDREFTRQCVLIEEPALEISSEPVNQEGRLFAIADLEVAERPSRYLHLGGRRRQELSQ